MTSAATGRMYRAIGLMSGTSMDGIDAALIETDGEAHVAFGPSLTIPYDEAFKDRLRRVLGPAGRAAPGARDMERELTIAHAEAVKKLLARADVQAGDIDIVGFHGHTVHHDPARGVTVQLGDGQLLADWTGMSVACDFRSRDVAKGGEGAPLVPVFHAALARSPGAVDLPVAVLNIGGVANVTWVGAGENDIVAFDTGPGNARINDWVRAKAGLDFDDGGRLAQAGQADEAIVEGLLAHAYFDRPPPKSIDRQEFCKDCVHDLSLEDGAATLTRFVVRSIARAGEHFPHPPKAWIVTGGGRHNAAIMKGLRDVLKADVRTADGMGWDGDALEAQAFAYLAVRTDRWLPISFPTTTGAPEPLSGGTVFHPS